MARVSKKRERTSDEDVVDTHDATLVLKKSKLDSTGKAEVTKKSAKEDKPKKEKKDESEKKEKKDKKDKKDKKEKKDKKKKSDPEAATETANKSTSTAPEPTSDSTVKPVKDSADDATKSKKDKKKTKKKSKAPAQDETPTEQDGRQPEEEQAEEEPATNGKPTRFICFVGNLPFTATADSVRAHFATLQPTSVRLLTQRDNPSKSRGIAFVEFGRYDHMKTCLEKFHHTEFDDGKSAARRINVELTAGGGGKTPARRDKIKQKNAKLNEERAQRMKKEEEAKQAKSGGKTQEERDEDAIHPSRRARVPYGRR